MIHGEARFNLATLDDFVLLKSDGWPTYHLAHVVDDHEMQTTHVIRGDEWLPSLPKHVLLFRAFDWEPPQYAHLPLLLSTKRKKLSKRDGDMDVASFLRWCLPHALLNFIALLGWNPSDARECYTLDELTATFDLAHVNRSPAVVDFQKLEWINGEYIRQLAPSELLAAMHTAQTLPNEKERLFAMPVGIANSPPTPTPRPVLHSWLDDAFLTRVLTLEQPRLKRLDALPDWYFQPVVLGGVPLTWKQTDAAVTRRNLEQLGQRLDAVDPWSDTPQELETIIKPWITERQMGVGETLWPMRVALSGQRASPSPFELAWLFGKDETIRRIAHAIQSLA